MTKSKSKIFIYFLLAVSLILCSMLALTACGEPYQMTYGTYNSYGIRTSNASGNTDLSLEEAREQGNIIRSTYEKIIFNEDGTVQFIDEDKNETDNATYTVDNNGYVTFEGEVIENDPIIPVVFEHFNNHGYFENNNFYLRAFYNDNPKSETLFIFTLNQAE